MAEHVTVPACPAYLAGSLAAKWAKLAPPIAIMGCLDDLNADLLAKYILAENEYLKISEHVQRAINGDAENPPDGEAAAKWLAAQDRLTKQILSLGDELGLTPKARKARGLILPRSK